MGTGIRNPSDVGHRVRGLGLAVHAGRVTACRALQTLKVTARRDDDDVTASRSAPVMWIDVRSLVRGAIDAFVLVIKARSPFPCRATYSVGLIIFPSRLALNRNARRSHGATS